MRKTIVASLLIILLIAFLLSFYAWFLLGKPNSSDSSTIIFIKENTTLDSLIKILDKSSVIKDIKSFETASRFFKLDGKIKPGRYRIKSGTNNKQLVRVFQLGLQEPHNLVLAGNIRTLKKLSSIISEKISADSSEIYNTLTNFQLIDSLGFDKYSFLGMFILNTYEIYWTTKPKDLIIRLHKEYLKFWNPERLAKAKAINLSPSEVITLASIVAEESNLKSEHKIIAGVYINRIKRGIPLQADPTIKYALNDPSIKRILYKHLTIDSPYNTYKKAGLPPGPITLPSQGVIDAVLNYATHNYLYFCANASLDGSHNFATTLVQHNQNARAYQHAISKLK